jgi:hypothetical protein
VRPKVILAAGFLAVVCAGPARAEEPLPAQLAPAAVKDVKRATVLINVKTSDGEEASGSGFFALKQGLVITNAHVLGMLSRQSKQPKEVTVVVNSGQATETKLKGTVLGVDRVNDLGIVKVEGTDLPAPLPIETKRELVETQKVYACGFPFGDQLGKDITISESSVTSLRTFDTGTLQQIQVGGGIHPGNSGGPLVNTEGRVIGVAVSAIRGTQLNFAIPASFVSGLANGRVSDSQFGEAFKKGEKIILPVKYTCLDPLKQIKEMRLEVWAGPPGQALPPAAQEPKARTGDDPRRTVKLNYDNGNCQVDVELPSLAAGQVCWLQPVFVTVENKTHWGPSLVTPASLIPVDRKPAKLAPVLEANSERTVKLKSVSTETFSKGKLSEISADKIDVDLLEVVTVEPTAILLRLSYGPTVKVSSEFQGRAQKMHPETEKMMRALPPSFIVTKEAGLKSRISRNVNPKLDIELREDYASSFSQLCTSLEAAMLPIPARTFEPLEKYTTNVALLVGGAVNKPAPPPPPKGGPAPKGAPAPKGVPAPKGGEVVTKTIDLNCECTYEGTRTRNNRTEALFTVVGQVKGRSKGTERAKGDVTGKFGVDLEGGFVSLAQIKIFTEIEIGGDMRFSYSIDVDLDRQPGNPLKIQPPPERKPK